MQTRISVSYTHLDVYKRQAYKTSELYSSGVFLYNTIRKRKNKYVKDNIRVQKAYYVLYIDVAIRGETEMRIGIGNDHSALELKAEDVYKRQKQTVTNMLNRITNRTMNDRRLRVSLST